MNSILIFLLILISIILIILISYQNINNKKSNLDYSNSNIVLNLNYLHDPLTNIIFVFSILFLIINLIFSFNC